MQRKQLLKQIADQARSAKIVALLGPRQSGKTTLARQFVGSATPPFNEVLNYFDLEDPAHIERLANPKLALGNLEGLVVIDEIQHRPELFPVLRVLVDRPLNRAQFLILGSASRDLIRSGILHRLLGIPSMGEMVVHPKLGASWEGFALEEVLRASGVSEEEAYYWGVHNQAELDLLLFRKGRRLGFEVKYTDTPRVTTSQRIAPQYLRLDSLTVICPGDADYPLADRIRVQGLSRFVRTQAPG